MTTCDEVEEKMRRYWTLALNEGQWSGSRFGRFTLGSMTFSFVGCLILTDWAMKLSRRIRYVVAQLVEDSGGRDSPDNHSNKNNCGNWSNQYTLGIPHTVSFDYKKHVGIYVTVRYYCPIFTTILMCRQMLLELLNVIFLGKKFIQLLHVDRRTERQTLII
jgi:hypothetical protein